MRAKAVALCMFLGACRTAESAPEKDAAYDAGISFVFADANPAAPVASVAAKAPTGEARLAPYASATPKALKSIGHTSVVFRVDFDTGVRAAYKPESKRGHKRYRGEIASYRLGKLLRLPNVPPAGVRVMSRDDLRAAAQADARALSLFDDEVVDHKGRVFGALMPWIDKLEFTPVESPAERARWKKWLTSGEDVPDDQKSYAAQISTLVVFDALTGNWDRWSGANVGIDKAASTLLFVDNDAAFFDPIPPAFLPQIALLKSIDRFSRALVGRLRELDALILADAFGDEEPGTPLLAPRAVAAADQRRKDVLAVVDEKIKSLGEGAVLYFP
jgi:hypothetical protein